MLRLKMTIAGILAATPCSMVMSQDYVPLATQPSSPADPNKIDLRNVTISSENVAVMASENNGAAVPVSARSSSAADPQCANAPTLNDISSNFTSKQTLLSVAGASKVGLAVANFGLTGDHLVLVQDYSSVKECLAADGATVLQYGRAIRTIITIANTEASAALTLPVVAANATISSKKNSVQIQVLGFSNPEMDKAAATIFGKELNVESYGDYALIQKKLVDLAADPATQKSIVRLGVVPKGQKAEFSNAAVISWALQSIALGRSCADAQAKLPRVNAGEPPAEKKHIADTYIALVGQCNTGSPSALQRATAQEYLYKIKVG